MIFLPKYCYICPRAKWVYSIWVLRTRGCADTLLHNMIGHAYKHTHNQIIWLFPRPQPSLRSWCSCPGSWLGCSPSQQDYLCHIYTYNHNACTTRCKFNIMEIYLETQHGTKPNGNKPQFLCNNLFMFTLCPGSKRLKKILSNLLVPKYPFCPTICYLLTN